MKAHNTAVFSGGGKEGEESVVEFANGGDGEAHFVLIAGAIDWWFCFL